MSLKSILLGDAPSAQVSTKDTIGQDQKDALKKLLDTVQGPAPQVSVPVTGDQQALIDSSVGGNKQAQGEVNSSTTALKDLLNNPAGDFQQQVTDPLLFDFQNKIMPQISRGFGNDFFSTERQKQDRFATEDLIRNLVSEKSNFLRQDRGVQLNAAQGLSGNAGQRGDILSQFLQSAGTGRDITQGGNALDEQVRQQLLQMLLQGSTAPTKETVGISKGGSTGLLSGLLQGVASNPKVAGALGL